MKKIFSVLVAAAMLMTLCAFGISAADEPTMTVSTVTAERGQTVTLDVVVSGNPGMNAAVLKPVYDETALELVSMKFNMTDFNGQEQYGKNAVWAASSDNTSNGTFLTLEFNVLEGASVGTTEVTLSNVDGYLKDGAVSNSAAETVNYKVVAGGVNVFDPTAPVINVSTVYGLPGDTVTVSVSLANNPGIMAAALKPVYDDSVLELVKAELNTTNFSGQFTAGAKVVWAGSADNATNGEFITLTFKVLDGAEGSTVVSIAYDEGDICNEAEEDVIFAVMPGSVIFSTPPTEAPVTDDTAAPSTDDTTEAPATTAGTEPTNPTAPQTADAGIAVAAVALAAAACFVAVKKRK